jgi:hypothetical protein
MSNKKRIVELLEALVNEIITEVKEKPIEEVCECCIEEKSNPFIERGNDVRSHNFQIEDLLYLEDIVYDLKQELEHRQEREYYEANKNKKPEPEYESVPDSWWN